MKKSSDLDDLIDKLKQQKKVKFGIPEVRKLSMQSGGVCAFNISFFSDSHKKEIKDFLEMDIKDECLKSFIDEESTVIAEAAHIIPEGNSLKRSSRLKEACEIVIEKKSSFEKYSNEEMEKYSDILQNNKKRNGSAINRIYLCKKCHKRVDKPELAHIFTISKMFEMKGLHSKNIYGLKSINKAGHVCFLKEKIKEEVMATKTVEDKTNVLFGLYRSNHPNTTSWLLNVKRSERFISAVEKLWLPTNLKLLLKGEFFTRVHHRSSIVIENLGEKRASHINVELKIAPEYSRFFKFIEDYTDKKSIVEKNVLDFRDVSVNVDDEYYFNFLVSETKPNSPLKPNIERVEVLVTITFDDIEKKEFRLNLKNESLAILGQNKLSVT